MPPLAIAIWIVVIVACIATFVWWWRAYRLTSDIDQAERTRMWQTGAAERAAEKGQGRSSAGFGTSGDVGTPGNGGVYYDSDGSGY
jgi:hypothetical protein